MPKVREEVWIDGRKHIIEREMTFDEYESELYAQRLDNEAKLYSDACKIAQQHGRMSPTQEDINEAKSNQRFGMMVLCAIIGIPALIIIAGIVSFFIS